MVINLLPRVKTNFCEVNFTEVGQLRSFVTKQWSEWGQQRLVTRDHIDTFSNLTDNHQWIHEDEDRCMTESPYGALVAHGFFILVLLPSLLPRESFVVTGHAQRIVRGSDHFRFPSPVFPDDIVQARVRLRDVRISENGKGIILIRDTEIWSTTGTKPAVTCSLQLQYF